LRNELAPVVQVLFRSLGGIQGNSRANSEERGLARELSSQLRGIMRQLI